jgi:hypothetical protein
LRIITPKDIAVDMDECARADSVPVACVLPWASGDVSTAGRST